MDSSGEESVISDQSKDEERERVEESEDEDDSTAANTSIPTMTKMCNEEDIKHKSDKEQFRITALTFIKDSKSFVAIDHRNRSFKLMDSRCKLKCILSSVFQPWDIATFSHDLLVVTFPFVRLLQFMKVKPGASIDYWYPVQGGNEYYGVAVHRGCIVATCTFDNSPNVPSVHYINKDGTIVNIIHKSIDGKDIFDKPSFIAVNEEADILYVTDIGKNSIIALNEDGKVLSEYMCQDFLPGNVAVYAPNHTVFVAVVEGGAIMQFDTLLRPIQRIVGQFNTIKNPLAIQSCNVTDRLFISNANSSVLSILSL